MNITLCPQCGSGKLREVGCFVARDIIIRCDSCSWQGTDKKVITASTDVDAASIAAGVAQQYMIALADGAAKELAKAMVASGVLATNTDLRLFGRVVRAATLAAHKATFVEIEKIQKELSSGNTPH